MSQCKNDGQYRYTWPGRNEAVACSNHVLQLKAIAEVVGFNLQFIFLSEEDKLFGFKCQQEIEELQDD